MKHFSKRTVSVLLVLCLVVSLFASTFTVSAASYPTYNNGTFGELCTSLSSFAKAYYTGSYTYEKLSAQSGTTLKSSISALVNSDRNTVGYNGLKTYFARTDAYNGSSSRFRLFYCGVVTDSDWDGADTWNREHMWPDSKGGDAAEGDLHSMRPTDPNLNSTRGNLPYGNATNGTAKYSNSANGNTLGGYLGGGFFEPLDNVKGDVARAILYDYCTYSSLSNLSLVFQSTDVLLDWIELDPVDEFEMCRNDVIEGIQGCRNPFVDYPELAFLVFSKSIPTDMPTPSNPNAEPPVQTPATIRYIVPEGVTCSGTTESYVGTTVKLATVSNVPTGFTFYCWSYSAVEDTTTNPSGYSANSNYTITEEETTFYAVFYYKANDQWHFTSTLTTVSCDHENTEVRNAADATCTETGYTGDTYCTDCGACLKEGTVISALGHNYEDGYCTRCGEELPCPHENTELRGAVDATCTEDGYTGDTYCTDCGQKVYSGVTIKAMGHDFEDGVCTQCGEKDPDASENPDDPIDPDTPECYFEDFTDCTASWYHEAVDYTVANELMKGVGEGLFDPSGSMTRAMIVTVLYRAAGSPEAGKSSFTDVTEVAWYADAIAWAQKEGIVNGVSDTKFAPMDNVTREQIAAILWRYTGSPKVEADLSSFKDAGSISSYAVDAITWAVSEGILNGDNGSLKPTANATRAEFACIVMRYLDGSYNCAE